MPQGRPRSDLAGPLANYNLRLPAADRALMYSAARIHARLPSEEGRLAVAIHSRRSLLSAIDSGWLDSLNVGGELGARRQQLAEQLEALEAEAFAQPAPSDVLRQALGEVAASN